MSCGSRKFEGLDEIVRAASVILRDKGIRGMSVGHAMKGEGLTVGAFYAHFADREELVEESFSQAKKEIAGVALEGVAGRAGRQASRSGSDEQEGANTLIKPKGLVTFGTKLESIRVATRAA